MAHAAPASVPSRPADKMLADYFRAETAKLSERCLADIKTLDDWQARQEQYRQQLFDMLGLAPLPERTDLKPVVTGKVEHEQFTVENMHFQSRPGLYVTANLFLPKRLTKPAPTILYLSGHGPVVSNKVSYGNKVAYQHHGAWFARNGYVCLVTDTLQLGEILGLHHGTYRERMWWWNARGYTPAGVEAWNSIRALDYLATRPEVDTNRFGVTGRSGGGAYSWWMIALDDRVKAAAPVAGITDLQNHAVDGTVEGHCDCMFIVNTYRWDYPLVAALAAPRPLLLVNTDSDTIFPLDGVMRTHAKVKRIYELHRAANQFGLVIGPGPHKDTQNLQVPVFRWFNEHLKGADPVIEMAAMKLFTPQQLRVFNQLPADAINTNIQDTFVAQAKPSAVPQSAAAWGQQRDEWLAALRKQCFAGWPEEPDPLAVESRFSVERDGLRLQAFDFTSQAQVRLRLYALQRSDLKKPERVTLIIVGQASRLSQTNQGSPSKQDARTAQDGPAFVRDRRDACPTFEQLLAALQPAFGGELREELAVTPPVPAPDERAFSRLQQHLKTNNAVLAFLAPRGVGLTAWSGDERKQTQLRRRFMLLGQTLDGMRVWDIRRAVQAVRSVQEWRGTPLWLEADGPLAADALYASLFEPQIAGLELWRLPVSHRSGPDYLNVLRVLDLPQAVAMAAERCPVRLRQADPSTWEFAKAAGVSLGWGKERLETTQDD